MTQRIFAAVLAMGLGACASTQNAEPGMIHDPYEGFNRQMFAFNTGVDKYALGPAANVYETVTPEFGRDRVGDFLHNLKSPVIFVNDVLQGEGDRAGDTFARFLVNTTVGVAGLWDVAGYNGMEKHAEDFGQTLAVWGVDSGPFLVLPLVGPTTPRDLFGAGIDRALDPLTWTEFDNNPDLDDHIAISRSVLGGLNARVALDDEIKQLNAQPEPYIALRRIYSSQRQAEIRNGRINEEEAYDDLPDFDEFEE
ncbi:VacJ family lipoprotein [Hyphomonas sp.]|jgi:phospholipid-binding lipoprotein MlaA